MSTVSNKSVSTVRSHQKQLPIRNGILGGLAIPDFYYLRPLLEPITLKERSVLQEPNEHVEYVNFVETGVISLMTLATDSTLETAMVSSRGFTPASAALGARTCRHRSMVLIPGSALRIRAKDLQCSMHERPQIRERLLRYVQALLIHGSQTALCGVRHQLEQRLACWICLACDAVESDILPITHDHLSATLGLRRTGITESLTRFEDQGLVLKMRGTLQICDRKLLGQKACSCYRIIENAYKCTNG